MVSSGRALSVAQCARRALRSSRPAWSTDLRGTCIGKRNKTVSVTKVWHEGCKRDGLYRWGVRRFSRDLSARWRARGAPAATRRTSREVLLCAPPALSRPHLKSNFKGAGLSFLFL